MHFKDFWRPSVFGYAQTEPPHIEENYNSCLIIPMIRLCFLFGIFCDSFFPLVLEKKNASVAVCVLYIQTASLIGLRS